MTPGDIFRRIKAGRESLDTGVLDVLEAETVEACNIALGQILVSSPGPWDELTATGTLNDGRGKLPDDTYQVFGLSVDGTPLDLQDHWDLLNRYEGETGDPKVWFIDTSTTQPQFRVMPAPDSEVTVIIRVKRIPAILLTPNDKIRIPNLWIPPLTSLAMHLAFQSLSIITKRADVKALADLHLAYFQSQMAEAIAKAKPVTSRPVEVRKRAYGDAFSARVSGISTEHFLNG